MARAALIYSRCASDQGLVSMNLSRSLAVFTAITVVSKVEGSQLQQVDKCIFYSENLLHMNLMVALQFLYYMTPLRQLYLDHIPISGTLQFGLMETFRSMQTCNANPPQHGHRVLLDSAFATQVLSQFEDRPTISVLISRILSWSPFSRELLFERRYTTHYSNLPQDIPAGVVDLLFSRLVPLPGDLIETDLNNGDDIADKILRPSSVISLNGQDVVRTLEIVDSDDLLVIAQVRPDSNAFELPVTLASLPPNVSHRRLLYAVIASVPEGERRALRVYVCKDYSRRHWYGFTFGRQFVIEEFDYRHFVFDIEPGQASLALFIDERRLLLYDPEHGVDLAAPSTRSQQPQNHLSSYKSIVWMMIAVFWVTILAGLLFTIIKVRQWRREAKTLI